MKRETPLAQRFPGIASIVRNGAFLTGTQWSEAALRAVYVLVIGRFLGPELYGVWSFAIAFYTFAIALTAYGFDNLVPLRLGQNRDDKEFLAASFALRFGLLSVAAVALAAYAMVVEPIALAQVALLLVVPALIGRGLVLWARLVFLGRDQSGIALRIALRFRCLEVGVGLLSLVLGAGVFTLLIIHALGWCLEAAAVLLAIKKDTRPTMMPKRAAVQKLLVEGFPLALSAMSLAFLTAMPLIFTRYATDDLTAVGHMGLAIQITAIAVMGVQAILAAALPVVGRAARADDPRLRSYPALVAVLCMAVFGVIFIGAAKFAPSAIPTLFGADFAPTAALLGIAFIAGGLTLLPTGFWQVLVARGQNWAGPVAGWSAVIVFGCIFLPLVSSHGAWGALAASAISWGVRACIIVAWALATRQRPTP